MKYRLIFAAAVCAVLLTSCGKDTDAKAMEFSAETVTEYVMQDGDTTVTVMQNVMMPLLLRGYSHKDAAGEAAEKLEKLGMKDRMTHKPNELSGGQQQRAAIARALIGKPALLLADEPTGALDSATGKEVLALFKELNSAGNTIVMITHDLNVAKYAQRIVRIVDGRIYNDGEEPS